MPSLVLLVPGRLETRTGGYEYDRRIVDGLRARGWSVIVRELHDSFPRPTAAARADAARALAAIPDGGTVVIDGLALGAMPSEVEREAARLRPAALIHHPLAAETGIDAREATELQAGERRALAAARMAVVTSQATAAALVDGGVAPDRVFVVEPGTDRQPLARGSQDAALHLLCVATLIPRKGHELLLRALAATAFRRWRLTCIGSRERHPPTTERLRTCLREWGLGDRVELAGEVDAPTLAAHYDSADVFVLPTFYEGYGMAVAEALARGLPVVSTCTGAIPDLLAGGRGPHRARLRGGVPEAGLLVAPGDGEALAGALGQMLGDARVRQRCARGARTARDRLPTWEGASGRMASVLDTHLGQRSKVKGQIMPT